MDLNSVQPKPFGWMLDVVWLNLVELSNHELFTQLLERVIIMSMCIEEGIFFIHR